MAKLTAILTTSQFLFFKKKLASGGHDENVEKKHVLQLKIFWSISTGDKIENY